MIGRMRDVIVAANWKMHTTPADAGELALTIAARTREAGVVRVICPPFVCLAAVRDALADDGSRVAIGAQNVHHELPGAYTGEISAPMLAGLATWVIVGHSERRRDAGETDELIGRKLGRAVDAGLRPILCVGEQLDEREAGRARTSSTTQLAARSTATMPGALAEAGLVIAYEPVWAIGTGRNASGPDAAAMADAIRAALGALGWGPGRSRAGPVRRQRHLGQHRRVPGRALDRRRARRWRLAQARRDGRDRGAGRADRRAHAARRGDRRQTTAGRSPPAPDRPGRPRRLRHRPRPGDRCDRAPPDAGLAGAPASAGRTRVLRASEDAVGLPPGQMGNSEVGHLNLGAGRPVLQDLPRIDAAIADGCFFERPALLEACRRARRAAGGSTSSAWSGPAASTPTTATRRARRARRAEGVRHVRVHALLDGRDTPPRRRSGSSPTSSGGWRLPTRTRGSRSVGGRYFAMDRDTAGNGRAGYDAIVHGVGQHAPSAVAAIEAAYARGENDEFVAPTVIDGVDGPSATATRSSMPTSARIARGSSSTPSRCPAFDGFDRSSPGGRPAPADLLVVTMTEYEAGLPVDVAFPPEDARSLAQAFSEAGWRQFHVAETEKYAHVTYFFNGGVETPYPGEERLLVPSPRVATYDLQPEMSAPGVTDALVEAIGSGRYDFIVANFANPDMVGHTGVWDATIDALVTIDACLGRIVDAIEAVDADRADRARGAAGDHRGSRQRRRAARRRGEPGHGPFAQPGALRARRSGGCRRPAARRGARGRRADAARVRRPAALAGDDRSIAARCRDGRRAGRRIGLRPNLW